MALIPDGFRTLARRTGSLLALTGIASLAGCGDTDQRAASDGESGPGGASGSGDSSSDSTDSGSGTGSSDTEGADCATQVDERQAELDTLDFEIESAQWEYDEIAIPERGLELLATQLEEGFPAETMEAAKAVAESARESVVVLDVYRNGELLGSGTGWYISEHEVVTNAHVIKESATMANADTVDVIHMDGTTFNGHVIGAPEFTQPDIALVESTGSGTPLPVHTDLDLEEGQPLVQIGHPGGVGNWFVTMGMFVTRVHFMMENDVEYYDIRTTVPGKSGVSGSPLLDLDGRVVGLTWGATPPWHREFGDPPSVAPDVVYDTPLVEIGLSNHLGAESVKEYVEGWRR